MKPLWVICFIIFTSCNFQAKKMGELFVESDLISLDNILINEEYTDSLNVKNIGTKDLKILDIKSDCHCTIGEISNDYLKPGEATFIIYNIKPNMTGFFQQKIIIKTNSEITPLKLILIRGKAVEGSIRPFDG